jgi:hypothetical protein
MKKNDIQTLTEKIRSINGMSIELEFIASPVDEIQINQINNYYNSIPPELISIFREFDGAEIVWNYYSENINIKGTIKYSSLSYLFGGLTNTYSDQAFEDIIWFDSDDDDLNSEIKSYKLFEGFDEIGLWGLISPNDNYLVHIYDNGKLHLTSTSISLYTYISMLALGIPYWQYLLINDSDEYVEQNKNNVLTILKMIAPDNINKINSLLRR